MANWDPKANEIFLQAIELGVTAERFAYLDAACAGDADLRRIVEALLQAHADAGSFLDKPGEATVAPQVEEPATAAPTVEKPGTTVAGRYKLPRDLPITAKLVAKGSTYHLDLGDKSADAYKKLLKGTKLPKVPVVDFVLEFSNTSDKEVQFLVGGDSAQLHLELKGAGAVSLTTQNAFTTDIKRSEVITLGAGKSYVLPVTRLMYGFRGAEKAAYWTAAGNYTITARFTTGISPAPQGTALDANHPGFGSVTLDAGTVKVVVEAAK